MTQSASFTSATSRHALPLLFAGQAQKEFTVNEALARLDLLVHPAVEQERSDPPVSPQPGTSYLVASNATGLWQGQDASIAGWDGTQWTFVQPRSGVTVWDASQGQWRRFDGGWQLLTGPSEPLGGNVVDAEARAAIGDLITTLKNFGIFS